MSKPARDRRQWCRGLKALGDTFPWAVLEAEATRFFRQPPLDLNTGVGWTRQDLADQIGVKPKTVQQWAARSQVSMCMADQVAIRLGSHPAVMVPGWEQWADRHAGVTPCPF